MSAARVWRGKSRALLDVEKSRWFWKEWGEWHTKHRDNHITSNKVEFFLFDDTKKSEQIKIVPIGQFGWDYNWGCVWNQSPTVTQKYFSHNHCPVDCASWQNSSYRRLWPWMQFALRVNSTTGLGLVGVRFWSRPRCTHWITFDLISRVEWAGLIHQGQQSDWIVDREHQYNEWVSCQTERT